MLEEWIIPNVRFLKELVLTVFFGFKIMGLLKLDAWMLLISTLVHMYFKMAASTSRRLLPLDRQSSAFEKWEAEVGFQS